MKNKFFVITAMMIVFTFCFTGCGKTPTPETNSYSITYDEPVGYYLNFNCSGNTNEENGITYYEENSIITTHISLDVGYETTNLQVLINGTAAIISGSGTTYSVSFPITQNLTIAISGIQPILRTVGLEELKTNYYLVVNDSSTVYTGNTIQIAFDQTCKIKLVPKYNHITVPDILYYTNTADDLEYEYYAQCNSNNYLEPITDSQGSRTFEFANSNLNSDTINLSLTSSNSVNYATLPYNRFYNICQVSASGETLETYYLSALPNSTIYLQVNAIIGETDGYSLEGLDTCTLLINGKQYSRNNDGLFEINNVLGNLTIQVQGISLVNETSTNTYYKINLQNDTLINTPLFQNEYGSFLTNKNNQEQYVKTGMSVSLPDGYEIVSTNGLTTFETSIDNTTETPMTVYTITSITGEDTLEIQTTNSITIPVSALLESGYEVYYRTNTDGDYTELTNTSVITVANNGSFTLKLKFSGEYNYSYPVFGQVDNPNFMFYVKAQSRLTQTNVLAPNSDLFNNPIIEDSSLIYIIQKTNDDIILQVQN